MHNAMEQAGRIIDDLGERPVAGMAYATAWAARLTTDGDQPVFPQARQWLRDHQHPDGSWGGRVPNPYDRLVSTVAAVLALREVRSDNGNSWVAGAVLAGVDYLRDHASDWRGAVGEPIGFEVVAPHLISEARSAGLLSIDSLGELVRLRDDKLSRVPTGALAKQPTGLLYSLEALEDLVPLPEMAKFAACNGSMANNPAATGALWSATKDPAALDYLHAAARSAGDGGMPEIYPINVFEPSWVIYLLGRAELVPVTAKKHVERLVKLAGGASRPVGVSEEFPVPDSDDTAMVANISHAFGYDATPLLEALLSFETDGHFVGFAHERGAPVSANARVLEAFAQQPQRFAPQIAKATSFLLDTREESAWWYDKWHLSPYYATAQAVFGLTDTMTATATDTSTDKATDTTSADTLAGTWRWLLDGQHPDGSWGTSGGTPEETAYAVLSLDALAPWHGPVAAEVNRRAHAYLREHLDTDDFAELWIGKGLYTPPAVVRAAVLSAYALSGKGDDD
jgi:halimadienyl-diphosphate synthase